MKHIIRVKGTDLYVQKFNEYRGRSLGSTTPYMRLTRELLDATTWYLAEVARDAMLDVMPKVAVEVCTFDGTITGVVDAPKPPRRWTRLWLR